MNGIYLTSFFVACAVSLAKGEPVSIPRTDSGGFGNLGSGFGGNLVGNLGGGFGGGPGGGFGGGLGNIQIDPGFAGPSNFGSGWGQPQITKEFRFPPPPFDLKPQTFDIKPQAFPGIQIGYPVGGSGFPGSGGGFPGSGLVGGPSGPAGNLITSSLGPALGGVLNSAINTGVGGEVSNNPSAPGCYAGNVANVIQELLRSLSVEIKKCNSAAECGGIGTGQCGNLGGAPSAGKVCLY